MQEIELGDGVGIRFYFEGTSSHTKGQFIGATLTPPEGGTIVYINKTGEIIRVFNDNEALAIRRGHSTKK